MFKTTAILTARSSICNEGKKPWKMRKIFYLRGILSSFSRALLSDYHSAMTRTANRAYGAHYQRSSKERDVSNCVASYRESRLYPRYNSTSPVTREREKGFREVAGLPRDKRRRGGRGRGRRRRNRATEKTRRRPEAARPDIWLLTFSPRG